MEERKERMSTRKSTADILGEHRNNLRAYYTKIRNPKTKSPPIKPVTPPLTGYPRQLAIQIEEEELKAHEKCLNMRRRSE